MIRLPTTDIYLRNACHASIRPWWQSGRAGQARPLREIAPNAFTCGAWMVLMRRDTPVTMRAALAWRGRLAYVVDDDIASAADSPDLPASYRERLARFDGDWHRHLLTRADVLVVPSQILASRLAGRPGIGATVRRIEPCWREPFADLAHFDGLAGDGPLRIGHLGTASHQGALEALVPALEKLLRRRPLVELTYIAASPGLDALASHPRVRRQSPRRWAAYRRWLPRQRFHLALYPLLPTAFDRARSANKLVEHAVVGAVGVYPEDWQPGAALARGGPGVLPPAGPAALLAPPDPADWADALEAAIERRAQLGAIAAAAAQVLSRRDLRAGQQKLWSDILGTDLS